jgi:predicted aconitase with swiveling domain
VVVIAGTEYRVLVAGEATGAVLRLAAPISFWGGVDPTDGRITDPRHPDHGASIAGHVLVLPATIGSSSSSAILLELLAAGKGPAALILGDVDAILVLGVLVAGEMGYGTIPVLEGATDLSTGRRVAITADGRVVDRA